MSDDRFKQARRSLIDRKNQSKDTFGDDFEDEATALVDLNAMEQPGGPQQGSGQQGQHPPPPGMDEDKTEMISLDEFQSGTGGPGGGGQGGQERGDHPSLMIGDGGGLGGEKNPHSDPPTAPSYDTGDGGNRSSSGRFGSGQQTSSPQGDRGGASSSSQGSVVIGDASDFEGSTQFINIEDFAEESAPQFTPDDYEAGYEGSTQFINLAELQAGAAAQAGPTIENDSVLKQGYQFGPESIQRGEFTLIFAQNAMGKPVILKQVWEGDTSTMPAEVRQRVAALDQIRHPRLVALNGMLASETGAWVELDRPPGYRLTDIVQQNGPQPVDNVMEWMRQVGEVLNTVHSRGFAYANLTTDAVWVQEDGSVVLEPFDVLTFENRGNLGVFGPPELNVPPEQMILSPATDVYSLACVLTASLTGIPLNLNAVQTLETRLQNAVSRALQQDPSQRTQTVDQFFEEAVKKGFDLPAEPKVLIGGAAALLVVGTMAYAFLGGGGAPAPGPAVAPANGAATSTTAAAPETKANGEPAEATVAAPGEVFRHESIRVETSYVTNPPVAIVDSVNVAAGDPEELRAEAREAIDGVEKLYDSAQEDKYREALMKMTSAIRLSEMTEEDAKFLEDLFERSDVKKIRTNMHKRVNDAMVEKNLSSVKTLYPKLAGSEYTYGQIQFFTDNKSVGVTRLTREGAPADEEKKDD